ERPVRASPRASRPRFPRARPPEEWAPIPGRCAPSSGKIPLDPRPRDGPPMKPRSPRLARTAALILITRLVAPSLAPRAQDRASAAAAQEKDKDKDRPEPKKDEKDQPKKKPQGLPLKPDRTIEFTTDEGTWVSLDVSPDGRTILFELL